jgi:ketosteroid isomerase-like protein
MAEEEGEGEVSLMDQKIIQDASDEVLAAQSQFWQALRTKDQALFEAVLAPDFLARSPREVNQRRESLIAILLASPATVSEVAGEEMEVHFVSDLAVLSGVQVAHLHLPSGANAISRVTLTNVFRRDGKGWQMVFSHAYELVQPDLS